MSSPLSMLKKTRRAPLPAPLSDRDRHRAPLRRNMLKEFQTELADDDDDDDDDKSSDPAPLTRHTAADDAATSKSKASSKKGPSDFELMSAMMQRVSLLERQVMSQAKEIERKDKRISALEAQRGSPPEPGNTPTDPRGAELVDTRGLTRRLCVDSGLARPSGSDHLERRCRQLQSRVCEMDGFLSDYGLIWVGDDEREEPDASVAFDMNFDLVLQSTRQLSILGGEGECFVRATAKGAQLARKDPIQLALYRNGIVMFEGPFRSYEERSTQRCMQDLMDGYFPSELQDRFPGGVPFEVHDRRDQDFISRTPWSPFPGEGKAVRGQKDEPSDAVASRSPGKKLSADQFLNRLPRVVVKAGCVIDIRDSLRAVLQGSSDAQSSTSVILVDTPALQVLRERLQTSSADRASSPRDVVALKVKSEDGIHTYVLKMCVSETMGDLRRHLDQHRGGGLPGYDIISAFPQRRFDDLSRTLQSCGLTTAATLLMTPKKRRPPPPTEVNKVNL